MSRESNSQFFQGRYPLQRGQTFISRYNVGQDNDVNGHGTGMATHTTDLDQSKMSVFSSRHNRGMLKPSRRPRPLRPNTKFSEFGPESCDLQINTFYQAPIGQENWAVKHIKLRSQTVVFNKKKQQ